MGAKTIKPVIDFVGLPSEPAWYIVITQHNKEYTFVGDLCEKLEVQGLRDKIVECIIPVREVEVTKTNKQGKSVTKIEKDKMCALPNYVFVKAVMGEDVWDYLRQRKGVSTVKTTGGFPDVLTEEEVNNVKIMCDLIDKKDRIEEYFDKLEKSKKSN